MRRIFYWLFLLFLGLPSSVVANREICGTPPPDQFKEENSESIKGDLTGKANLLSSYVGKAELGGKIEAARKEVFAKYPDANTAYLDRYFAYMFCFVLFDPKNQQNPNDKIKAIQEFKRQQQSQSFIEKSYESSNAAQRALESGYRIDVQYTSIRNKGVDIGCDIQSFLKSQCNMQKYCSIPSGYLPSLCQRYYESVVDFFPDRIIYIEYKCRSLWSGIEFARLESGEDDQEISIACP